MKRMVKIALWMEVDGDEEPDALLASLKQCIVRGAASLRQLRMPGMAVLPESPIYQVCDANGLMPPFVESDVLIGG